MTIEAHETSTESEQRGARIRALRESLGISQGQLASDTGLSQGYLSETENGKTQHLSYIAETSIVRALGVGYDSLEGQPDLRVFLRPEARKLFYIISSPRLDVDRKKAIELAVDEFFPDTEPSLKYIDTVPQNRTIGQIIQELRGDRSRQELEIGSSVPKGYLVQIENNEVPNPSLHILRKISKGLDIDINELLGVAERAYPREIEIFDRFLRSEELTSEQKAGILDGFTSVLSLILQMPTEDLEKIAAILNFLIYSAKGKPQSANQDSSLS